MAKKETIVVNKPIRYTNKFLEEFKEISVNFVWYYVVRSYEVNNQEIKMREIRGVLRDGEDLREYTPLTSLAYYKTGKYFEINRFDLASYDIEMSPSCCTLIIDASDEWPDRLHGYMPKPHEIKLRNEIEAIINKKGE